LPVVDPWRRLVKSVRFQPIFNGAAENTFKIARRQWGVESVR
jgi:hypothetical protein